ncbi:MAG: DUF2089 family protein [Armatimonadota bacterium]|nr:DUF2089 family protein [Armatimonadota bacterium]
MTHPLIGKCPVCGDQLEAVRLQCRHCATTIEGRFTLGGLARLDPEQVRFVETFLKVRGNLKEMERELGVSYPTVRARLDAILQAMGYAVEAARAAGGEASVMLAAKDYGGDLARLGAVLDETCRDARCVGIVGPVLSREAAVVVARAVQWRVPAVSPTATGPMPQNRYLFRTALTAQAEGTAVARYATQHLGMKRFAVITPQDRYSLDVVTAFSEEVARQGGRLIFSATYEPGAVDFGREIKRLKEVDLQQEGVLETLPSEDTAPGAPPPEPVYVPGFDAVFLPGDGETAGLVAAQLRFFDIAVPLLGSSGWNQRGVIRSGGKYVEDAIFVDAFSRSPKTRPYSSSSNSIRRSIAKRRTCSPRSRTTRRRF